MSTPPPAPPPGYYPPPVPSRASSSGCWKAAGLTCGVLFLLALVGVIIAGRALKESFTHPTRGSIFGMGVMIGRATVDGKTLQKAIVGFHAAHGKYPNTLLDLVREGRIDGKILHNDLDASPSPASISWHYTKPAPGAPGSTPILTEHYVLDIPGARGSGGSGTITVTLDGETGSTAGGVSRTTFGKSPSGF